MKNIWILTIALVCLCGVISAQTNPYNWDFATGTDMQGWTAEGFVKAELTNGAIRATTNQFSFLYSPTLEVDADKYKIITFTAKSNTSGNGSIYFRSKGQDLADARSVAFVLRGDGVYRSYKIDMSVNSQWKGTIEQIRLDPLYVANSNIEVLRIGFRAPDSPEDIDNIMLNGDFLDRTPDSVPSWSVSPGSRLTVGPAMGRDVAGVLSSDRYASIEQKVEFDLQGNYILSLDCAAASEAKMQVKIRYFDIFGKPIKGSSDWTLSAGGQWKKFRKQFKLPDLAASGILSIGYSSSSPSKVYLDNVVLLVDKQTNIETDTLSNDKAFNWSADWIWSKSADPTSKQPVYFRKVFRLPAGKIISARAIVTADNEFTIYVNGNAVPLSKNSKNWRVPDICNISRYLGAGENVVAVKATNMDGPAGLLLECAVELQGGRSVYFKTDGSWKTSEHAEEGWKLALHNHSNWNQAAVIARPPAGAWADVVPYTYLGPLAKVNVTQLAAQRQLLPGKSMDYKIAVSSAKAFAAGTYLYAELVKAGSTSGMLLKKVDLGAIKSSKASFTGSYKIPAVAAPGKYLLRLSMTNSKLIAPKKSQATASGGYLNLPVVVRELPVSVKTPQVEFKMIDGSPILVINGKKHTSLNYWAESTSNKELIKNCSKNGIHIYWVGLNDTKLLPSGKFDLSEVDQECTELLTLDPDAYIMLLVPVDGVYNIGLREWLEKQTADMAMDSEGSREIPDYGDNPSHALSLASGNWMNMSKNLMKQIIKHAQSSRYADRIIGYLPCSGVTYEWQQWASTTYPPVFVDYSEPARVAFTKWLKDKYTNVDKLNIAWNSSFGKFDQINIPTKEQRLATDYMNFLDPAKSMREIDYRQYYSELVADDIIELAKLVKQESAGRSVVGFFYGYVSHVLGPYRYQLIGHSAMHRVLTSPEIDFVVSPSDYGDRQIGGGSGLMGPVGSVKCNNKVWIDQADLRTHHSPQTSRFTSLSDSKAGLIRNYANALINQCSEQIYDFSLGWTSGDARLMQAAGRLQQIDQIVAKVDRSREDKTNSLAVIIDEKSTYYTAMASYVHLDTVTRQYFELSRTGAGFDVYLLDDIDKIPEHKVYLFLNTFRITQQHREIIDNKLKNSGKTLIFVYAPGITDAVKLDKSLIEQVIGMPVDVIEKESALRVKLANIDDPVLAYAQNGQTYGTENVQGPVIVPRAGKVLGYFEDNPDLPGLVINKEPQWTCIYSSAPGLPANLLRAVLQDAGARITNPFEGDITYASGTLAAVHTLEGGFRKLDFGKSAGSVVELISGKTYKAFEGIVEVQLDPRSTVILLAKP